MDPSTRTQYTLSALTPGTPVSQDGLTVIPLTSPLASPLDYLLLEDGVREGVVTIRELSEGESVPELEVENRSELPVLIVDGEELTGAMQNRVANLTLLIPGLGTTIIPVSCVEAGRWSYSTREFDVSDRVQTARGRAAKLRDVRASIRHRRSRRSDQSRVWDTIAEEADMLEAASPTGAMSEIFERHATSLDRYVEAFSPVSGQVGAIFVMEGPGFGRFGLDLFDKPETFAVFLPKLVRSYAVSALEWRRARRNDRASEFDAGVADLAKGFLNALIHGKYDHHPAVGLGRDVGVVGIVRDDPSHYSDMNMGAVLWSDFIAGLVGGALVHEDAVVHFTAFSEPGGDEEGLHRDRHAAHRRRRDAPDRRSGPALRDRARGLMEGLAVGNLLGVPFEFGQAEKRWETDPAYRMEILVAPGSPDDDDLAQAIVLARAAAAGPLDVDDLGRRFWVWAEENGAGMGGQTGRVLTAFGGRRPRRLGRYRRSGTAREPVGVPIREASRRVWRESARRLGFRAAGNGAVMRSAPLAVRWFDDDLVLVRNSVISAVPTHWDRRCGWSCALVNLAAAHALSGALDREGPLSAEELIEHAEAGVRAALPELAPYGYRPTLPGRVRAAVMEAEETEIEDLELRGRARGYTLRAMKVGLSAYWHATDFESALETVVMAGGDTDTNAAVAGAVLGARFGMSGIPGRWRRSTTRIRQGRTPMAGYAERLLEVGG